LTVIDGIIALEGDGPWRYGTPKPMGLLVAGADLVEVDNVCLRVMGFPPEHAPHIPYRRTVDVVGLSIEEVAQGLLPVQKCVRAHHRLVQRVQLDAVSYHEADQSLAMAAAQVRVSGRVATVGHRNGPRGGVGGPAAWPWQGNMRR